MHPILDKEGTIDRRHIEMHVFYIGIIEYIDWAMQGTLVPKEALW
jgi:hypothetical protein